MTTDASPAPAITPALYRDYNVDTQFNLNHRVFIRLTNPEGLPCVILSTSILGLNQQPILSSDISQLDENGLPKQEQQIATFIILEHTNQTVPVRETPLEIVAITNSAINEHAKKVQEIIAKQQSGLAMLPAGVVARAGR